MYATNALPQIHDFPALQSLGIGADQLRLLATQGFLHAETTSQGRRYVKLRFREHGVQRVKYVGRDASRIRRIEQELAALQRSTRSARALARCQRLARQALRRNQRRVATTLITQRFYFHGREIRRRRRRPMAHGHSPHFRSIRSIAMPDSVPVTGPAATATLSPHHLTEPALSHPLQHSLHLAIQDLLGIAGSMSQVLQAELAPNATTLRELLKTMPAINTLTLVHRQVARYVQLDQQMQPKKSLVDT